MESGARSGHGGKKEKDLKIQSYTPIASQAYSTLARHRPSLPSPRIIAFPPSFFPFCLVGWGCGAPGLRYHCTITTGPASDTFSGQAFWSVPSV
eukprot:scaffold231573_cov31-Tisochrysis_lutea.AAC.3